MAWTASVVGSEKTGGSVHVTVSYTDGQETFEETYRSSNPTADWIPTTVFSRIAMLDTLDAYDIPNGPVTPVNPDPDPKVKQFQQRVFIMGLVESMVNLGYVPASNPRVQALGNWLLNNIDYLETLEG